MNRMSAEVEAAMRDLVHAIVQPEAGKSYRDWLLSMQEKARAKRAIAEAASNEVVVEQADRLIDKLQCRAAALDNLLALFQAVPA